jgi:PAS domain S-box-containing protein
MARLADQLERLPLLGRRRPLAYGYALALSVLAWWLRWALDPIFPPGYPYLTFFPAVILSSFLFGRGPGTVAGITCGLLAWYFFIPPTHSFLLNARTAVALAFYAAVVTVDIALVHWMQRAGARLRAERERSRLVQGQLRELNMTLEQQVEQRTAELRLHRDIVQSHPTPICAFDVELRLTEFNQALSDQLHDISGRRVRIGDVFPDLVPDAQKASVRGFMERALQGEVFTISGDFGDAAPGTRRWETRYAPLKDETGRIIGAFVHALDISERIRAEAELRDAQDQLRQAQKMEAIGQLTGGVAHDFNNLLTVIRGSVDLLRKDTLPPERRARYVEAIGETADRAAKLTGQLLAFARRQTLRPEIFDVVVRLRSIADMLDSVTGARVKIVIDAPDHACIVRADSSQFETALVNMAVNARDAMAGEGVVRLRVANRVPMPPIRGHAAAPGAFVTIAIGDSGAGIAAEDMDRIFEPFFTTKEVGRGTGLGLSQVVGFAKQSGGDVDVASRMGEGTTFTLYLPEAEPDADRPEADTTALPPVQRSLRVLVVEDNVEVGRFCTQMLEDFGHSTAWASSGEEALTMLEQGEAGFDVVFSDVVMPGMGGIELAKRLARIRPDLPIILASGYSHVLAQEGTAGFELLQKPYSAEQVSRALQRAAGAFNGS